MAEFFDQNCCFGLLSKKQRSDYVDVCMQNLILHASTDMRLAESVSATGEFKYSIQILVFLKGHELGLVSYFCYGSTVSFVLVMSL